MAYYTDGGTDEDHEDGWYGPLYTENPRDREPGILTYDDREYLFGLKEDVTEGSEAQLRQRMRDRIRNGLLDFEILMYYLEDRDIQTIFDNISDPPWPSGSDGSEVYHGTEFALAFIYHGITECTHANFEKLLESAIERSSGRSREARKGPHHRVADATVNIEVDWVVGAIDHEHALEKLRSGDGLSNKELGSLVRHGDLNEEDWERLREETIPGPYAGLAESMREDAEETEDVGESNDSE